jgi:hypothetical protein
LLAEELCGKCFQWLVKPVTILRTDPPTAVVTNVDITAVTLCPSLEQFQPPDRHVDDKRFQLAFLAGSVVEINGQRDFILRVLEVMPPSGPRRHTNTIRSKG